MTKKFKPPLQTGVDKDMPLCKRILWLERVHMRYLFEGLTDNTLLYVGFSSGQSDLTASKNAIKGARSIRSASEVHMYV